MRTIALGLAAAFFVAGVAHAGGNDFTQPGRIDKTRYNEIGVSERHALDTANKHWNALEKQRDAEPEAYEAPDNQFELFVKRFDQSHVILPYAIFMRGMCHLRMKKRGKARQFFDEVMEFYPESQDAVLALYWKGVSYVEETDDKNAVPIFEAIAENADQIGDKTVVYHALVWLKEYHEKQWKLGNKAHEAKYVKILHQIAKDYPANRHWGSHRERRRGDQIWQELFDYYKWKEDWSRLAEVAGYRYEGEVDEGAVEHLVFTSRMDVVGHRWKEYAKDSARQRAYRSKVNELIQAVEGRLNALQGADEDRYRNLALNFIEWYAKASTKNDDFEVKAGERMLKWMQAHPKDRHALRQFYDYARHGEVQGDLFDKTYAVFLKDHRDDHEVRWWYVSTIGHHWREMEKADQMLRKWGGKNWDLGHLWMWRNWEKAAEYFKKAYEEEKELKRQQDSAWYAGEALRNARQYEEAIKFYREAQHKMVESNFNIAECLNGMGRWEEAVRKFREVAGFAENNAWKGRSLFRAGEVAWANDDRANAIKLMRKTVRFENADRWPGEAHNFLEKRGIDPKGGETNE